MMTADDSLVDAIVAAYLADDIGEALRLVALRLSGTGPSLPLARTSMRRGALSLSAASVRSYVTDCSSSLAKRLKSRLT
jgi:hypothetical protein